MGVARKQYTPDERRTIIKLSDEGWTYKDIATRIRPGVKSAWRSVGDIVRQHKQNEEQVRNTPSPTPSENAPRNTPPLLAKKSKIDLPDCLKDSFSAREYMTMLDDDQRELFIATYEDLRGEADDEQLTKAENEMLMRAAFSHVKYLRAQSLLAKAESFLMMDLEGYLGNSDDDNAKRRFSGRSDAYKKEAEQWYKEYMDYLDGLKLTRKQRLDKIKDTRNTFLDLQQELMNKERQGSIVEEIKKINTATKEEFYRMSRGEVGPDGQRHSWLIGAFDDVIEPIETDGLTKQNEVGAKNDPEDINKERG